MGCKLIGLAGYARSGKDTVGAILVQSAGYTRVAFADKVREVLYTLNPVIHEYGWTNVNYHIDSYPVRVQDVIDALGWEGVKSTTYGAEIRGLLQRMGTEVGRNKLRDDIWVTTTLSNLPRGPVVITDVRFANEVDAIRAASGQVYRVNRPGTGPINNHPSETAIDFITYDGVIDNSGTLDELKVQVNNIV